MKYRGGGYSFLLDRFVKFLAMHTVTKKRISARAMELSMITGQHVNLHMFDAHSLLIYRVIAPDW